MSEEKNQKASELQEALQEKATTFFKENPKVKAVFGTADGFLFTHKKLAANHAETLEDQEVHDLKNPNEINVEAEEVSAEDTKVLEAEKELLSIELISNNYQAMKTLVKVLDIQVTDQKAETIIKALEDYKTKIKE